jgi:hypothetical protein
VLQNETESGSDNEQRPDRDDETDGSGYRAPDRRDQSDGQSASDRREIRLQLSKLLG